MVLSVSVLEEYAHSSVAVGAEDKMAATGRPGAPDGASDGGCFSDFRRILNWRQRLPADEESKRVGTCVPRSQSHKYESNRIKTLALS